MNPRPIPVTNIPLENITVDFNHIIPLIKGFVLGISIVKGRRRKRINSLLHEYSIYLF